MTDIEYKRKKASEMEADNERSFKELNEKIAEYGGQPVPMNAGEMRLELLIDFLKARPEFEETMLDFEIASHEKIGAALNDQWAKLREAIARYEKKQRGLSIVKNPEGLVDQHGRPLRG